MMYQKSTCHALLTILLLVLDCKEYVSSMENQAPQVTSGLRLTRVELFPAGQGVFEFEAASTGDTELRIELPQRELDDLLKSMVLRGFDTAKIDYPTGAARAPAGQTHNKPETLLQSDMGLTRAELLQGLRGHLVTIERGNISKSGRIVTVEFQVDSVNGVAHEVETVTLQTALGLEQVRLSTEHSVKFSDPQVQQQLDLALRTLNDRVTSKIPVHISLLKKTTGPAALVYQTETSPWKCSYRIAKIGGEYQLVASAVIDNSTNNDWKNVELVLIVDQPLGFHAPLGQVHVAERRSMALPSPFSVSPPSLSASSRNENRTTLALADEHDSYGSPSGSGYGAGRGGGMGGMGGGGMGMGGMGGYVAPASGGTVAATRGDPEHESLARRLGLSFAPVDMAREHFGQRVHIRLRKVSIPAGGSETIFLPTIPHKIIDVRYLATAVSIKHPLAAFEITLQNGYQLPGGPGSVWSEHGYLGDIMFPRLVADIPQLVTYAIDSSIEVTKQEEVNQENPFDSPSTSSFQLLNQNSISEVVTHQRLFRYQVNNDGLERRNVVIEHEPAGDQWIPEKGTLYKPSHLRTEYRYEIAVPPQQRLALDVREHRVERLFWDRSNTVLKIKQLLTKPGLSVELKSIVSKWLEERERSEGLIAKQQALAKTIDAYSSEQRRIKDLIESVKSDEGLRKRFVSKLGSLEDQIESARADLDKTIAEASRQQAK